MITLSFTQCFAKGNVEVFHYDMTADKAVISELIATYKPEPRLVKSWHESNHFSLTYLGDTLTLTLEEFAKLPQI